MSEPRREVRASPRDPCSVMLETAECAVRFADLSKASVSGRRLSSSGRKFKILNMVTSQCIMTRKQLLS
jgi:hypothetical protein